MLLLDSRIKKNKKIPWRIVEDEAILVNVAAAAIIHLNEAGAEIWRCIEADTPIRQIIGHICDTFDINEETARNDTLEFVELLSQKGVVENLP